MRLKNYKYKIAQFKSDLPKPKKNEVVIIPRDNRLLEIPPVLNKKTTVSWWKDLPKGGRSLRRCQGTYDYLGYGLTIPAWTDFSFRARADMAEHEYRVMPFTNGDNFFQIDVFPEDSASGCPLGDVKGIKGASYLKLVNPCSYYTAPGTSLMIIPALHSFNPNFLVMPGLVHTDFYHQMNIVITVLTDQPFEIKAGEPLAHVIPIQRNRNIENIVFGNESMYRFAAGNGIGTGCISKDDNSQLYRKLQREYDEKVESKCPFSKK